MSKDLSTANKSRRRSDKITLSQVAQAAGVSPITASRALNHPDKVSDSTRQSVLESVERLGYVPNLGDG